MLTLTSPQTFISLVRHSFFCYGPVFKKIFPLFLLASIINFINMSITVDNKLLTYLLGFSFYLIETLIVMLITLKTNALLTSSELNWKEAYSRYFPFLGLSFIGASLLIVGFACLIIPGIFLTVIFIFTNLFFLLEHQSIKNSFKASFQLVKKQWKRTFGMFFLIFIAIMLLVVIGDLLLGSLINQIHFSTHPILFNMSSEMILFFLSPLIYIFILHLFNDLKMRSITQI